MTRPFTAFAVLATMATVSCETAEDLPPEVLEGPGVVHVRATGRQFEWTFHYPGSDGIFGSVAPRHYLTNPAGLDPKDSNGFDDFITPGILTIPADRPVVAMVTSQDVIHNLTIPQMRVSQDAIPGAEIPIWFKAEQTGSFQIRCGQLCGKRHSEMKGRLNVVTADSYDQWLKEGAPKDE